MSDLTMAEKFHMLVNIEDYPDMIPRAHEWARAFFEAADYGADPNYAQFDYSDEALDERLEKIYNDFVRDVMYEPHRFDSGIITWNDVAHPDGHGGVEKRSRQYSVGRFSDTAVREELRQKAPFNLVDGAWLQNILSTGPCNEVQARLFSIWEDEAGNGKTELNHCNVYDTLLKSLNIFLPPITSREFIEQDFIPSTFDSSVLQLSAGLFPEEFFPELLGMTLYLEWEATPTLTPTVRMLAGRRINPQFYRLHVAIDNISVGHGALAKEAVKIYLAAKREEGGDQPVQDHWKRIWNGYVTWATTGDFGPELMKRLLALDNKQINIDLTPSGPTCLPNLVEYRRERMRELIRRKAPYARQVHRGRVLAGQALNELFGDPDKLMKALVDARFVDPEHPRASKFLDLLKFSGPMYKVFTEAEKEVILDWVESLRPATAAPCIEPLPEDTGPATPGDPPAQMAEIIKKYASVASLRHAGINLANDSGKPVPLADLFADPPALMAALVRCGWVVPGDPGRSMFLVRVASNGGPMDGVFEGDELSNIRGWIQAGARLPGEHAPPTPPAAPSEAARDKAMAIPESPSGEIGFGKRRQAIGMGAVH